MIAFLIIIADCRCGKDEVRRFHHMIVLCGMMASVKHSFHVKPLIQVYMHMEDMRGIPCNAHMGSVKCTEQTWIILIIL